jgi:hypothetical protein
MKKLANAKDFSFEFGNRILVSLLSIAQFPDDEISFIVTAVRQLRKAKAKAVKAANHLHITVGKVKICAV